MPPEVCSHEGRPQRSEKACAENVHRVKDSRYKIVHCLICSREPGIRHNGCGDRTSTGSVSRGRDGLERGRRRAFVGRKMFKV